MIIVVFVLVVIPRGVCGCCPRPCHFCCAVPASCCGPTLEEFFSFDVLWTVMNEVVMMMVKLTHTCVPIWKTGPGPVSPLVETDKLLSKYDGRCFLRVRHFSASFFYALVNKVTTLLSIPFLSPVPPSCVLISYLAFPAVSLSPPPPPPPRLSPDCMDAPWTERRLVDIRVLPQGACPPVPRRGT